LGHQRASTLTLSVSERVEEIGYLFNSTPAPPLIVDLLDQPCEGSAGSFGQLKIWSVRVRPSGDGSEMTINAGDAYRLAPGHDAWVVGDEPAVGVEFSTDHKEFAAWTRGEG
tara:strand:- start:503 stop:838 length:336 start_codon:yes stop_codon:yes gene_type:complete